MTKQRRDQLLHITLAGFAIGATVTATLASSLPPGHKLIAWMACASALFTNLRSLIPKPDDGNVPEKEQP